MVRTLPPYKEKSIKPYPPVVKRNHIIDLPPELDIKGKRLELALNVIYINNQSFVHSVDWLVMLLELSHLGTKKKGQNYTKAMLFTRIDTILRHYNKNDISVLVMHANNGFRSVFNELEDL